MTFASCYPWPLTGTANGSGGGGAASKARDSTGRTSGGRASQLMVARQRSEAHIASGSTGGSWGAAGRRRRGSAYSSYYAQLDPEQADGEGACLHFKC